MIVFVVFYSLKFASGILPSALIKTGGTKRFSSGSGRVMPLHGLINTRCIFDAIRLIPWRLFLPPAMAGDTWRTGNREQVHLHAL